MPEYYDGTKLLSLKDINGNTPEIYICVGNRTAGKTTWFNRKGVNGFIKKNKKFMTIARFNYELDNCAEKFFKDINTIFFPGYSMFSIKRAKGIYHDLYLLAPGAEKSENCGYAVALNNADQIKKMSHLFSDVGCMIFDEFQSETNHYCPDEVTKLISLHTSVARGQGEMVRYVPLYMMGNPVTMLNPYYIALGIADRLDGKTRFMKGNGFVMEQCWNENAADAQKNSGFNAAFSNDKYVAYSAQGVYLNDATAFIERPVGKSHYLATLRYEGVDYGVRAFPDLGILYCDNRPDETHKTKLSVTTADHNINYVMLKSNDMFLTQLRWYFDKGCFRFKDLRAKDAVLKALCY